MNPTEQEKIIGLMLAILVRDFAYWYDGSDGIRPTYGHHPMRHQFAWEACQEFYGDKFVEQVMWNLEEMKIELKSSTWGRNEVTRKERFRTLLDRLNKR